MAPVGLPGWQNLSESVRGEGEKAGVLQAEGRVRAIEMKYIGGGMTKRGQNHSAVDEPERTRAVRSYNRGVLDTVVYL
jgi:hypothetical protein